MGDQDEGVACSLSLRADGQHGWHFDGDDPYIICRWCKEMRHALTGAVIEAGRTAEELQAEADEEMGYFD